MKDTLKMAAAICGLSIGFSLSGLLVISLTTAALNAPDWYRCYQAVQVIPNDDYILGDRHDCIIIKSGKPYYVSDIISDNGRD